VVDAMRNDVGRGVSREEKMLNNKDLLRPGIFLRRDKLSQVAE
jgi:hypothetical protein